MEKTSMKKIILSLLAAAALAACSKGDLEEASPTPPLPIEPDYSAPILPSAGIEATVQSRAFTGDAFPANTSNVFFVTAYAGQTTAPTNDWRTSYFTSATVNSGTNSVLSFATPQYYPANGYKLYFYANAPAGSITIPMMIGVEPMIDYTLTGKQDIIWAKDDAGIAKGTLDSPQTQPEFQFFHKLKKVSFKVVGDVSFEASQKLTKITIIGVRTAASLNLNTGALTFFGEYNTTLTAYSDNTGFTIPKSTTQMAATPADVPGSEVMFEPGTSFKVEVVAGGVTFSAVTVTLSGDKAGEAGVSHVVTLTFKRNEIVPTAKITPWSAGDDAGVEVV